MIEIWKDVKGYEGLYQVSNMSRIRNQKGHILSPADNGNGYLRFSLSSGNRAYKTNYLHRLVAVAFIPNPNNLPEVNHKDEDKSNNWIDNLEWCNVSYNRSYGTRKERCGIVKRKIVRGRNILDGSVVVLDKVADAEKFGFSKSSVSKCLCGRAKATGGYVWEYAQ